jgi:hypothetical protein
MMVVVAKAAKEDPQAASRNRGREREAAGAVWPKEQGMRRHFVFHAVVAAVVTLACSGTHAATPANKKAQDKDASPADSRSIEAANLVRKALRAEAAGDLAARAELLREAVDTDANFPPAHWQSGEVKVGERWLAVEDAARENEWSGKFVAYQQSRAAAAQTADGQMALARWCKEQGLVEQEKIHLANALRLQPAKGKRAEVINKLGLVRYRNQLMPAATAEVLKKQAKDADAALAKWKPILTRLRGDLESRDKGRQEAARTRLKESKDLAIIPALEAVFGTAKPESGEAAIDALAAMPQQAATNSLVRFALFAKHEEVRTAAGKALAARDVFSYAPQLLSAMQMLIEVNFQVGVTEGGAFQERLRMFQEGQSWNRSFASTAETLPRVPIMPNYQTKTPFAGSAGSTTSVVVPDATPSINATLRHAEVDAGLAAAAVATNAQQQLLNARIAAALRDATGNRDFDDDPRGWWIWWASYNEMNYAPKETYEQNRYSFTQPATAYSVTTPLPPPGHNSCFVAGTLVWTVTGTVPIEKVQVGDWVLAQDVESGELTYKPVEAVTKGPPLPLVEMHVGQQTIRCTHGHLFWVSGTGWRMAKELKVGDRLHTTKGTLTVDSVEKTGEAACHNLIIPDFNTYFVTDEQILVHDIDVRAATTATVPGLTAD